MNINTHFRAHTYNHVYCVCNNKCSHFGTKDYNLAIEKDYELLNQAKGAYIISVSYSLCCTRRITAIIPSNVKDVCVHHKYIAKRPQAVKKQKAYKRKKKYSKIHNYRDWCWLSLFHVVNSEKRTKRGISLKNTYLHIMKANEAAKISCSKLRHGGSYKANHSTHLSRQYRKINVKANPMC